MAFPNSKVYNLPRDWIEIFSLLIWFIPGLILLLGNIIPLFISFGAPKGFQDIWGTSILAILVLSVIFIFILVLFRSIKGLTLSLTSEGITINNKLMLNWDQVQEYEARENRIIITSNTPGIESKNYSLNIYSREFTQEICSEIQKNIKKNNINLSIPENKPKSFGYWFSLLGFIILGIILISLGIFALNAKIFLFDRASSSLPFWVYAILLIAFGSFIVLKAIQAHVQR